MAQDRTIENLDRERVAAGNNTAALCNEIGAIPDPNTMFAIRLNILIDHLLGPLELAADGKLDFTNVTPTEERMEFEVTVAKQIHTHMQATREQLMEARKKQSGLMVPGGNSKSGIVLPSQ